MNETAKATSRRQRDPFYATVFRGDAIDIGCGPDPLRADAFPDLASVTPWDIGHGDAQFLAGIQDASFDTVYSSHCLEHMRDVAEAARNWMRVLKPGGHAIIAVPDEDMYESAAGCLIWPSRYNPDHKWTFRLDGQKTHTATINLADLFAEYSILRAERITEHYDPNRTDDQTLGRAECAIEIVVRKSNGGADLL